MGRKICEAVRVAVMGLGLIAGVGVVRAADAPVAAAPNAQAAPAERITISGMAKDAAGKPLAGADVVLCYVKYNDPRSGVVASAKTADDGAFRFEKAIAWEPVRATTDMETRNPPKYAVIVRHADQGLAFKVVTEKDPVEGLVIQTQARKLYTVNVTEHSGKPVEGAKVFLSSGQMPPAAGQERDSVHSYFGCDADLGISSGITDAQGAVELLGFPGDCAFRAVKEGYAQGYGDTKILMSPGMDISGKVTMDDGKPAAGAAVIVNYSGERLGWSESVLTDAQGNYTAKNVPLSGYVFGDIKPENEQNAKGFITIDAVDLRPGSALVAKSVGFPAQAQEKGKSRDLTFNKACVVSGKVIDPDTKRPVAGAVLSYHGRVEGERSWSPKTTKADDQGRFRFVVAPGSQLSLSFDDSRDGTYIIDQQRRNNGMGRPNPLEGKTISKDLTDVVLELKVWDVQPLTGKVVNDKGEPVKDAAVFITARVQPVKTDAQGIFTLKCAPKDRDFALCAASPDKSLAGITRLPKGSTQATIELKPTIACGGVVTTPAGLPADNLKFYMDLSLNEESIYNMREEPTTDGQGKFEVSHLIPGARYAIFWSSDNETNRDYDFGNATVDMGSLKPGEPIQFQAKKYVNALMGKVVDPEGKPVEGARVDIGFSSLLTQDARFNGRKPIVTDKNGEFGIDRLADGELAMTVTARGFKVGSFKARTDAVDFVAKLRPASAPAVRQATVTDSQGKAMPDVPVMLQTFVFNAGKWEASSIVAKSDASGVARFDTPKPATAPTTQRAQGPRQTLLVCDVEGYDLAFSQGTEDQDLLADLVLRKSDSAWQGQLVGPDGKPAANVEIAVSSLSMPDMDGPRSYVSIPDPSALRNIARLLKVTSDTQGRFSLPRISTTQAIGLSIKASGLCPVDYTSFNPQQDKPATPKVFKFSKAARIKGHLALKGSAKPLEVGDRAYVILDGERGGVSAPVGKDGTFALESVTPGSYHVRFNAADAKMRKYLIAEAVSLDLAPGQEAQAVVELIEGIPVRGRFAVPPEGGQASVMICRGADGNSISNAQAGNDGSFELYVAEPGEYRIQYYVPGINNSWQPGNPVKVEALKPTEPIVIDNKKL